MKKSIIIALALLLAGIVIGTVGICAMEFDLTKLDTSRYETRSCEVSEDFNSISIDIGTASLKLLPSEDGKCKVICHESQKEKHSVSVDNGTLTVSREDNRKWYDYIGFFFVNKYVTVYLPKEEYTSLIIKTDTGDIEVSKAFSFESASSDTDTGDTYWYAAVSEKLSVSSDTGDIEISGAQTKNLLLDTDTGDVRISSFVVSELIQIKTDTGKAKVSDTQCENLTAKSDTGDITLKNVIAASGFELKNGTGDVELILSDAQTIKIGTGTGDVSGTLLSDKTFVTETSTGDISVPKTTGGGMCEVTTGTGDIELSIKQ